MFVIYNRNNGKIQKTHFITLQEAVKKACEMNKKVNSYNFLVTNINK